MQAHHTPIVLLPEHIRQKIRLKKTNNICMEHLSKQWDHKTHILETIAIT